MDRILKLFFFSIISTCIFTFRLFAQEGSECPQNIGFEKGDFSGWECYTGFVATDGILSLNPSGPDGSRHLLIPSSPNNPPDYYSSGEIKLDVSPNGSNYIIKLGNNSAGGHYAEGISYTFKIPDNAVLYSITYNYAVVFSEGPHTPSQQPKFEAKVFDVSSGTEILCGGARFTATSNLPGFKTSKIQSTVYYKDWSPVTINLSGYAGKTIKLQFTTNDCALTTGSHWGYAYIDIDESCASPITGNVICPGVTEQLTLKAPAGLKEYYWYNADDLSTVIGRESKLIVKPVPPVNTSYALRIVPYPTLGGCEETVFTTVRSFDGQLDLKVSNIPVTACSDIGADLTDPLITAGSSPGMIFTYHTDAAGTSFLAGAKSVKVSGTYYIKGTGTSGCFLIKPVTVIVTNPPVLQITSPLPVCKPTTVDLTRAPVTAGSTSVTSLSYWKDAAATIPLLSPKTITESGVYYIKASSSASCSITKPVTVIIADVPKLVANNQALCSGEAATEGPIVAGSSSNLTFSFWKDAACTVPIPALKDITSTGTYYVKALNSAGCVQSTSFDVTIYPEVDLRASSPVIEVDYPEKADMTSVIEYVNGLSYTYWKDPQASVPLASPTAIDVPGTYYIKAENANKCSKTIAVKVVIVPPPLPLVKSPNAFTPNADGMNDVFNMDITGIIRLNYFKVFDRWGQLAFYSRDINQGWDGKKDGHDAPTGTYYWIFDGYDDYYKQKVNSSGSVTLVR